MKEETPSTPDARLRPGFNLSRWAIDHAPLTRYLLWVLLFLGAVAYTRLGQDEDPPFTFRAMVVQARWPGASAKEVAEQVTDKIERALQSVPYVDTMRSYAKPGESLTIFQFRDDAPVQQAQQIWYQVRKNVGDMRATLPQGVIGPFFNDEFGDVFGSMYALSADGYTDEELRVLAETVRRELLRVQAVAKVEIFGVQPEKLYVEIPGNRLAQLGLDWGQLVAQIGAQNLVEGAGAQETGVRSLQVRVGGQYEAVDDLAQLPIRAVDAATGQARQMRLGDIAQIRRAYADPAAVKVRFQGKPVLALGVTMAKGGDIISLGDALDVKVKALQVGLPLGAELQQMVSQPKAVSRAVNVFVRALIEAVVIVLGVSFLALGLHRSSNRFGWRIDARPGLVVAISIPLVLAITFIIMYYWGIGLHKISLGSLIIALGLLVDDAIIAVEMMVRKLEEGYDRVYAASYAYQATSMPMLTGTLITAAGFLPIGLARSMVGEYTFAIFAVTTVALLVSWVVSVYFVPYLGTRLLLIPKHAEDGQPHELFDSPFYLRLRKTVDLCLRHRWLTLLGVLLTFVLGVGGMRLVQQQFFPDSNRPEFLVNLWLPEGATMAASEDAAKRFERLIAKAPEVESVAAWVGSGVPRFYLSLDQVFPQNNVSEMLVRARDLASREALLARLPDLVAAEMGDVRVRIKLLPNGPPVPYPVMFRLLGPDADQVRQYAQRVKDLMAKDPDLRGLNDNWNESVPQLRLEVDQDRARALGVTRQAITQASRVLLTGLPVGEYREGDRLIEVQLRRPVAERDAQQALAQAYVLSSSGRAIPLAQVASLRVAWEPGVMWRESRLFAVTLQGDVAAGVQGPTVSSRLWPQLQAFERELPPGYRIELAGAAAESSKGTGAIVAGVPILLFIVFTLLMLQLHSFSRAMLVFLTGPLGVAGVALALLVSGKPFGFVALLGVVALAGMIMRNSVILIDQIEQDRARGVPAWEAIVESVVRRFRPIVLTAAAAILAMVPLSRSEFWGPMAIAIMGGLVVATVLTLLGLPALYAAWFRVRPATASERAAAPAG